MARRPRLILPDVPLHIIQRGNNRNACFLCETDYRVYLSMLRQYANETGCAIHAYVLVTNHVHLLLSAQDTAGPSVFMRRLGQHYVQYFNRRHGRTGTLWEGRFRSCPVEQDDYLLVCQRYIELNPVRAGMVDCPENYPWSSYRSNALALPDASITPHAVYRGLDIEEEQRRVAYRDLFRQAPPERQVAEIRQATNANVRIGTPLRSRTRLRRKTDWLPNIDVL